MHLAHVQVQVAQMQQRIAVEGVWKRRQHHLVAPQLNTQRVALPATVQARERQRHAQQRDRIPLLEIEKTRASPKHMRFSVALECKALAQQFLSDALLQRGKLALFRRCVTG